MDSTIKWQIGVPEEEGVIDFDNNDYLTGNNSCVY